MSGYQKPNVDQRTNWRNHVAIADLLKRGVPVEILALADTGLLRYGAFHLNLAAGLEDSIVRILQPEWNGGRTSAMIESPAEADPPDTNDGAGQGARAGDLIPRITSQAEPAPAVHRLTTAAGLQVSHKTPAPNAPGAAPHFILTLHRTYYRSGFFNVPVSFDRYFGKDDTSISIYCGQEQLEVRGRINRTANTNGTPRIMGAVALREWLQKRKVMSHLRVSVLGPSTIHIVDMQSV